MAFLWIMMGPVNHATFVGIFILTKELDSIAFLQTVDAWSQINIVCNHQGLPIAKFQNKTLMTRTFSVITSHCHYCTSSLYLYIIFSLLKGLGNFGGIILNG